MAFLRHTNPKTLTLSLLAVASVSGASGATVDEAEALKFFETKVRPILSENCYECHGEKKQKGDLRLDNISYILTGGELGPAVVPGDAMASHLYKAVSYEDKDLQMPPKDKKLPDSQIEDLKKWIDMGAPWPKTEVVQAKKAGEFSAEDRAWWSYQPVKKVTPPEVKGMRIANPIDQFITAKLSAEKLPQAPQAERIEIVRRLYYNLHGLPPTPEQVTAFVEDKRPDAYEKLVEELMASPRYGIRWAQHWLDLARYSESDGYREDAYRPNAWPYRDWVIKSFNDDKPYNQFVREQLAGDEINPDDPNVLIGTAYLRNGIYEWNQADAEGQRELIVNEMTDVTGELFLGLSFACARCHDHKFDPILQKDYYRLKSFFTGVQWREDMVLATPEEKAKHEQEMKTWEESCKEPLAAYDAFMKPKAESARAKARKFFPPEVQAMADKPEEQRTPYEKQIAYLVQRRVSVEEGRALAKLKQSTDPALEGMKPFDATKPKPLPYAFVATDVGPVAPPTILKSRRGETEVKPGFLTLLEPNDLDIKPLANSTGRRTALANWITDPKNPLSTRVIVNRVWQYHFGTGLASNTSDFGRLGPQPTHPELLDWLTTEFIAHGWSLKWLHRTILTSETYRQSSMVKPTELTNKVDPGNKLLWRANPQRLDAEQTRDTLLMLSGEMSDKSAGPGDDATQPVRSIFTRKRRNSPDEFLTRFDAAPGFLSVPKRETTTTALQSLVMINGEWPLQRARAMAGRLLKEKVEDPKAQAAEAFRLAYSRPPTDEEVSGAVSFLKRQQGLIGKDKPKEAVQEDVANPVVDSAPLFKNHFLAGSKAIGFKPGSAFEKIKLKPESPEKLEFTVEAVVNVEAVYPDSTVRTIAARWNGETATKGWSLGLTGAKSKHKSNNLVLQLSGDDFQGALVLEVLVSNVIIPDKTPYYVAASISNRPVEGQKFGGTVTFYTQDLSDPNAKLVTTVVPHGIGGGYVNPERELTLGGRDGTNSALWNGWIANVAVANGSLPAEQLLISKPAAPAPRVFQGNADVLADTYKPVMAWDKPSVAVAGKSSNSPKLEALADLFHTLINSNEFFYLP